MKYNQEAFEWVTVGDYSHLTFDDIEEGKKLVDTLDESNGIFDIDRTEEQLLKMTAYQQYVAYLKSDVLNSLSRKEFNAIDDVDAYFEAHPVI